MTLNIDILSKITEKLFINIVNIRVPMYASLLLESTYFYVCI